MEGLVSFLIFVAVVALIAAVAHWALSKLLAAFGVPGNIITIAQVVIILIALLVIVQRAWPLVSSYA